MERIHAPEMPAAFRWLGTEHPLSLAALRGHVVVLDLWLYCWINCLPVLPVLGALEEKRKDDPVVVIGVHSAKSGTGGVLEVRVDGELVWSKKDQGRFPESKELTQLVRDRGAPGKDLGHSDRWAPRGQKNAR